MCDLTRRNLFLATAAAAGFTSSEAQEQSGEVDKAAQVANGVYFHQGDIEHHGHCNNGWIVFKDYVLVGRCEFSVGCPEHFAKNPGCDREADSLRLRHPSSRRSQLWKPVLGRE